MAGLSTLLRDTAVYGLSSIVGRLLNYLLVPMYTRLLVPGEYGVVTEFYAWAAFGAVLLTWGMETAFFRFGNVPGAHRRDALGTALTAVGAPALLLAGVAVAAAGPLAGWAGYARHPEYVVWFGLILALDALAAIPFAWLRARHRAVRFALLKLTGIGVNIGLNLLFLIALPRLAAGSGTLAGWARSVHDPEMGVGYIFLANLAASGVTVLLLAPMVVAARPRFQPRLLRGMAAYAFPVLVAGLAYAANETLDRILLKRLLPPDRALHDLGVYGACYKVSILMSLFIQSFRFAGEPFFFARGRDRAPADLARAMNGFVAACALIYLGMTVNLDWVMRFVGPQFREGAGVVPVLLLANLCLGVYTLLGFWFKLTDRTSIGAALGVGGAVVTVVLNLALVPRLGYVGSAWATLACYGAMAAVSYVIGQRLYPVPYRLSRLIGYPALSVGLYMVWSALPLEPGTAAARAAGLAAVGGLAAVIVGVEGLSRRRPAIGQDRL